MNLWSMRLGPRKTRCAKATAVTFVSALVVAAGCASAGTGFTDPPNDSPGGGDIRTVSVNYNTQTRTISFRVTISGMPSLVHHGDQIQIWIDADSNRSTGKNGVDCVLGLARSGWYEAHWTRTGFKPYTGGDRPIVSYRRGTFSVAMDPADCSITAKKFRFRVVSFRGANVVTAVRDAAPDTGFYPYTFATSKPTLTKTVVTVNAPPQSGQQFMVIGFGIYYADGTSQFAEGVKCWAGVGGAALRGMGIGGCQFLLPLDAKGKKLVLRVTGKTPSAVFRKTLSFTVK